MKAAVTGATGFIGRYLIEKLSERSVETTLILRPDRQSPSPDPRMRFIELDIHDATPASLKSLGTPDVLFHLAWGGLPAYRSVHHFESELPAHYRFLRSAAEAGIPNIVVAGTCFEYGLRMGCLAEDCDPTPSTPYGFAKDTLRRQLEFLKQKLGFNLTWARLFYVYGDGQANTSLLPQLAAAVQRGETVFNMSTGDQIRDFIPVTEAASVLVDLACATKDHGIVNVCSGVPVSVRRFVERWLQEHGFEMRLNLGYYPYPEYEPLAFWGDRTKLSRCINRDSESSGGISSNRTPAGLHRVR